MARYVKTTVLHTADLTPAMLDGLRSLMDASFDDWTDADSDHTYDGMHAVVREGSLPVAHAALVQRTPLVGTQPTRTGYVEGVAVHPDRRRAGLGSAVMAALEGLGGRGYPLMALSTSEAARGFYERRGWLPWIGPTSAMTPSGLMPTPGDDGGVYVRSTSPVDRTLPLACDWRTGDVW